MDSQVEDAVKDCIACQALTPEPMVMEPLRMSELPAGPWENISIDFCGPLPSSDYLFVMVDEYSRYPVVEIVRSVSANATIPVLDKVLSMFGCPKIIKSDNGSPFNSDAFRKYAEDMGFDHRRITPRWPLANAQAESFNKPLMKIVRAAHLENKNRKQEMFRFLRQYRATPHRTTGYTPHRLMFNREPKTKLPVPQSNVCMSSTDQQVRERDSQEKYKMKYQADIRNQARPREIAVGDTVLIKQDIKENKLAPKFQAQPKVVLEKKGPMVTVTGNVTRIVSRFKRVRSGIQELPPKGPSEEEIEDILWPNSGGDSVNSSPENSQQNESVHVPLSGSPANMTVPRRSGRDRKPNLKYAKDFV
ncbi:uncharacterized protein K02A2.6-like [Pecten maximus]|uniref:uncharacterized protein K02A2.6-like n=1 Tax=Pecten maximus TaxID=6579 RepID=UPI0014580822|nr:uncharacterized protein K02A2.6-like [Pecten maximus]